MKVYLSARFSRRAQMREVRAQLQSWGHTVTSAWIDHDGLPPEACTVEGFTTGPPAGSGSAALDLRRLADSDAVISFTEPIGGDRGGGRDVEFGAGLALGLRMLLVGPPEHVFHTLPGVQAYPDWPRCGLALLREEALLEALTRPVPQ